MNELKNKYDERKKLGTKASELLKVRRERESKEFNSEERSKFEKIERELNLVNDEIKQLENSFNDDKIIDSLKPEVKETSEQKVKREREAFEDYLQGGDVQKVKRALTHSGAGTVAPAPFVDEVMKKAQHFASVIEAGATVVRTDNNEAFDYPVVSATAKGSYKAENASMSDQTGVSVSSVSLNAYKITSEKIRITDEMLKANFDVWTLAKEAGAELIWRKFSELTVEGDDTTVNGLENAATDASGITTASGSLGASDILDLIHTIDPAYRKSPSFKLMFNDSTLSSIRQMGAVVTDGELPYNWQTDKVFGYDYIINPDVDDVSGGNLPIYAGDFSKYIVRASNSLAVKRLEVAEGYDLVVNAFLDGELGVADAIQYITITA